MQINPSNLIRLILFLAILAAVLLVWYFDLSGYLTLENMQRYKQDLGWWAPLVFTLSFVLGELMQVPSVLWVFLAGMIWPWWTALPLSLFAALLAATVAFLVARYFLGNRIPEKLPPSLKDVNERLKRQPVIAVVVVRLSTFLHPAIHWVLAASSVRVPAFMIGTLVGIVPLTLALVLLGEVIMSWWDQYSTPILATASALVVIYIMVQRRKQSVSAGADG